MPNPRTGSRLTRTCGCFQPASSQRSPGWAPPTKAPSGASTRLYRIAVSRELPHDPVVPPGHLAPVASPASTLPASPSPAPARARDRGPLLTSSFVMAARGMIKGPWRPFASRVRLSSSNAVSTPTMRPPAIEGALTRTREPWKSCGSPAAAARVLPSCRSSDSGAGACASRG